MEGYDGSVHAPKVLLDAGMSTKSSLLAFFIKFAIRDDANVK